MKDKIFILRSFGETIDFAEYLGWVDTYGGSEGEDWEPEDVDACEDEALDYIESKGWKIVNSHSGCNNYDEEIVKTVERDALIKSYRRRDEEEFIWIPAQAVIMSRKDGSYKVEEIVY